MVEAARSFAKQVQTGEAHPEDLTWESLERNLFTAGLPDPDLLIRTSGEQRISNFLLLQCAYAELYFTDTAWPEFGRKELEDAIAAYHKRQRRFGKTGEQVAEEVAT